MVHCFVDVEEGGSNSSRDERRERNRRNFEEAHPRRGRSGSISGSSRHRHRDRGGSPSGLKREEGGERREGRARSNSISWSPEVRDDDGHGSGKHRHHLMPRGLFRPSQTTP